MAEEAIQEGQAVDEAPQGAEAETDWKAEARKWERLAKKDKAAREELAAIKQSQMTEQEKDKAALAAAQAELDALKAERAKADAARRISGETGIPSEMLMFCADEGAMEEFASTYAEKSHVPAAPSASGAPRIVGGDEKPLSNGEIFADFINNFK